MSFFSARATCLRSRFLRRLCSSFRVEVASFRIREKAVFLSGGLPSLRDHILNELGFQEGSLLVWYLGVPIITSRLRKVDCAVLVKRITSECNPGLFDSYLLLVVFNLLGQFSMPFMPTGLVFSFSLQQCWMR